MSYPPAHSSHDLTSDYCPIEVIGRFVGDYDRYQIKAQIGKGGMGDVYQALDTRLGKTVAVKLLNIPSGGTSTTTSLNFKRRFERECAICATLSSEHIVQVSDYGVTDEGRQFYVMEYLAGQTLAQLLKRESKLSMARVRPILMQICAGLKTAHEGVMLSINDSETQRVKIIHRDLKPANIFLVPSELGDRVKIIDFGVAKIQAPHQEIPSFTSCFLGTHHYSAPEQFDGLDELDERLDIYCLGIILYEMLAGSDPFGLKKPGQTITGESWVKAHLLKEVRPLRAQPGCEHLSEELEQIVFKCLEKQPDSRFPSVQALAQALGDEQSCASNKIFSSFAPYAPKLKITTPVLSPLDFSKLSQALRAIHQEVLSWIEPLKPAARSENSSQPMVWPEQSANLPSYVVRNAFLTTPFTLSASNLELIDRCRMELSVYIGPIASLIVAQTLQDIQYHQAQKFIEALANRIPNPDHAKLFRRTFLASDLQVPTNFPEKVPEKSPGVISENYHLS